ncbi:hypothetical protein IQ249_01510 [Lusitaniella coriacea LEGE 07157]|uniref:Uncharacterized protein n=1 Tax=Lusitaniella coriacea LEGE 07157 TaxID=945747 RepID=A0A8J7DSQ6_9CYAN|nr:hypothetical protein [Lusitaniella coriacea]MBE9114562.1 hypothetical protein [Lusitaniella coriacea LEGE 07157]
METALALIAISTLSGLMFGKLGEKPKKAPPKDNDELVYKIEVKRPKPKKD